MTPDMSAPPLRVCTVSDGVDSVLRIARHLASLGATVERTDLELLHARDALLAHEGPAFDLFVLAPRGADDVAPFTAQAVLEAGIGVSRRQVVLLDGPAARAPRGGSATEILREAMPEAVPAPAAAKKRFRLFRRAAPELPPEPSGEPAPPVRMLALHGMSGGVGTTTLAVNLAVELAAGARVCLIDLDIQFGTVAAYLDLPPQPKILNAYRDLSVLDADVFASCLQWRGDLAVFAAPVEVCPLDALDARGAEHLLHLARQACDVVVMNLPLATTDWTETVYQECDRIYAVSVLDVRSAQNARRFLSLMRAAGLRDEKVCHVLNRVPLRPPGAWIQQREGFEKGLGRPFDLQLPEAGPEALQACNAGLPLAETAPKSPLPLAIRGIADGLRTGLPSRGEG